MSGTVVLGSGRDTGRLSRTPCQCRNHEPVCEAGMYFAGVSQVSLSGAGPPCRASPATALETQAASQAVFSGPVPQHCCART